MSDFRLWHYDGLTAVRRDVVLRPAGMGFVLEEPESGWTGLPADWSDLTVIGLQGDRSAYGHKAVPGWRMGFSGEAPADIATHLPKGERYGRWIDRFTRTFEPLLMAAIGIVVGAIVVLLYMPIFDLAGDMS